LMLASKKGCGHPSFLLWPGHGCKKLSVMGADPDIVGMQPWYCCLIGIVASLGIDAEAYNKLRFLAGILIISFLSMWQGAYKYNCNVSVTWLPCHYWFQVLANASSLQKAWENSKELKYLSSCFAHRTQSKQQVFQQSNSNAMLAKCLNNTCNAPLLVTSAQWATHSTPFSSCFLHHTVFTLFPGLQHPGQPESKVGVHCLMIFFKAWVPGSDVFICLSSTR